MTYKKGLTTYRMVSPLLPIIVYFSFSKLSGKNATLTRNATPDHLRSFYDLALDLEFRWARSENFAYLLMALRDLVRNT